MWPKLRASLASLASLGTATASATAPRLVIDNARYAGIAGQLFLAEKTVEGYVGTIFDKLGLEPATDNHRRILAVLTYLQER